MPQRPLEARRALAPARAKEPEPWLLERIRVRDGNDADVPALVRLINEAYRPVDWWIFERPRVRDEAEYRNELETSGGKGIVVDLDGVPVAHAVLWLNRDQWRGASIGMFATAREVQGKGIATILMHEAERRAREAGFDRLNLDCVRENGLPDYYESLGFTAEREKRMLAHPHSNSGNATSEWTRVYMSKELR